PVADADGVAGHRYLVRQRADDAVVLEQVRHGGDVAEVVRRHDLYPAIAVHGVGGPPEVAADTTETIDSHANSHSTKSPRRSPDRQRLRDYRTSSPDGADSYGLDHIKGRNQGAERARCTRWPPPRAWPRGAC